MTNRNNPKLLALAAVLGLTGAATRPARAADEKPVKPPAGSVTNDAEKINKPVPHPDQVSKELKEDARQAADAAKAGASSEGAKVALGEMDLFNGKDLSNWDGNPAFWSVVDGAIQGQTTKENPTKGNTFLVFKGGDVADFELRFKYKIVGGNSGVQYRSAIKDPKNWVVGGYQADFEAGKTYSGILYEEKGRGILAKRGQKVTLNADGTKKEEALPMSTEDLQKAIKNEDWNEYVITAKGGHLVHQINGNTTAEVIDDSGKGAKSGILALQLHAGPPMTVQFKDLRLKVLGGGPPTGRASEAK